MNRWVVCASLIACGVFVNRSWAELTYAGFNYVPSGANDFSTPKSDQELFNIQQTGSNTVTLDLFDFQANTTSTTIAPDFTRYSESIPAVQHAIDQIHSLGMNIILKPMVDLDDGEWRGTINPAAANVNSWFASYQTYIDSVATLAQQDQSEGVQMLSVGCELNGMEQYTSNWTTLINSVRSIYSGKLTYSANWSSTTVGTTPDVGGYKAVSWWNQLDEIGIDAYFPLTSTNNPTEMQLQSAWKNLASGLQSWRASTGLSQKILFTESGYLAQDGTNENPGQDNGTAQDLQEQADCYQALLSVMSPEPWFDGVQWWEWQPNSTAAQLATGDTPEGKPLTLDVLKNFFLPEPTAPLVASIVGLIATMRRRRKR